MFVSSESSAAFVVIPVMWQQHWMLYKYCCKVWAINTIELEGYNLERYTKFDVLFVLWTQFLKQMNFVFTRRPCCWCYFSLQLLSRLWWHFFIGYMSVSVCLSTDFSFVGYRAKVKLSPFCKKGNPHYINFTKKRTGFKRNFYPYCN